MEIGRGYRRTGQVFAERGGLILALVGHDAFNTGVSHFDPYQAVVLYEPMY